VSPLCDSARLRHRPVSRGNVARQWHQSLLPALASSCVGAVPARQSSGAGIRSCCFPNSGAKCGSHSPIWSYPESGPPARSANCESQYHIRATNVKREIGTRRGESLMRGEHHTAGDSSGVQFLNHGVGFRKWPGRHLAAHLACCCQSQNLAQVLAGAYGGCFDVDFASSH